MIMKFYENIPYANNLLRDVFGVGSAIGAGASVLSTHLTNQANKEIADNANKTQLEIHESDKQFNAEEAEKSREFNAQEAEKSREFNAQQAEIARQWSSEPEVMKRRAEAGLNTAITGQSTTSGGGSPSASSSPASSTPTSAPSAPHMSVPIMQSPDIAGIMQGISTMAKTSSEISKNNANAEQLLSDAEHKAELSEHQRIVNEWTPKEFRSTIDNLISKTKLNEVDVRLKNAQIDGFRATLDSKFMEGFALYTQLNLQVSDFNQQVNEFLAQFPVVYEQLNLDAQKFEKQWQQSGYDMSYKWGSRKDSYDGWNVGATGTASRGRSGDSQNLPDSQPQIMNAPSSTLEKVFNSVTKALGGVGVNINGGYQDYDKVTNHFRDEAMYKYFVEGKALSNIASSPKYSKDIQDKALQRMQTLTLSVEGYGAFLMQLGKIKRFPTSLEQDLEDQQ